VAQREEIERKFLVSAKPEDAGEGVSILQGYLPLDREDAELRVRRKDDTCVMTVKGGHGRTRSEDEAEIGADAFDALWPLTEGQRIEKTRYELPCGDLTIELDEYGGELAGLLVAEVEFGSEEESEGFEPPDWFEREVTGDARYSNAELAAKGLPAAS
jgi:adenylate cyclase